MLNKHNFAIGALVAKAEPYKQASLDVVQVHEDKTVVTDGSVLALVSGTDTEPANFPQIKNVTPTTQYEPFLIPASQAASVAKALPKNNYAPVLNHALVGINGDGVSKVLVTTDLNHETVFRVEPDEHQYFQWAKAIPEKEPEATFTLSLDLLLPALKALASFCGKERSKAVTFRFYGDEDGRPAGIRLDAHTEFDQRQHMTVVIMPFNDKVPAWEWKQSQVDRGE